MWFPALLWWLDLIQIYTFATGFKPRGLHSAVNGICKRKGSFERMEMLEVSKNPENDQ